jgi:glutaredoxin
LSATVVLYGRPGCCLCDDARSMLERIGGRVSFELAEQDIERDDVLLATYLERIPVITIDGREMFELLIDEHQLELAIRAASGSAQLHQ